MVVSVQTAEMVLRILRDYLGKDQLDRLLTRLREEVPGNRSWHDSIQRLLELHVRTS